MEALGSDWLRELKYAIWGGEGVWDSRSTSYGRIMSGSVRVSEGMISLSQALGPGGVFRAELVEREREKGLKSQNRPVDGLGTVTVSFSP